MNKKKLLVIALIVLCISLISSATYAYFTDNRTAHSVITTSGVNILVEEWIIEDGEMVPYPKAPIAVIPDKTVSKIVTVKNQDAPSLVRVSYEIVVTDKDGYDMELSEAELNKYIHITPDTSAWSVKTDFDGWYYYNTVLENGDTTVPLFDEVSFAKVMGNEFQGSTFRVKVRAEAVQAKNNALSAIDAIGWSEK